MARRRNRNAELQDRFRELARRHDDAQRTQEAVTSREPQVIRFRDEMRQIRMENHFTQLFLKTVGGGR